MTKQYNADEARNREIKTLGFFRTVSRSCQAEGGVPSLLKTDSETILGSSIGDGIAELLGEIISRLAITI
jgi:hypothetical protein